MTTLTPAAISKKLARRNKLLCRRDGLYDHKVIDRIDAELRAGVSPGVNKEVDEALGRECATLPKRETPRRIDGDHLHQCDWCGEWYTGARVDHGCPPPPISAMEQSYIDSFDLPTPRITIDASRAVAVVEALEKAAEQAEAGRRDWKDIKGNCDQ